MGRTSKPRKPYKRTWANIRPISFGMKKEIKDELAIAPLMALNMFTSGHGNEDLAYTLINSVLVGYHLAKDEVERQIIMGGSDSMKCVLARGAEGKWGFSGDDLKGVTAAILLSDKLQNDASLREMRGAVNNVLQINCAEA